MIFSTFLVRGRNMRTSKTKVPPEKTIGRALLSQLKDHSNIAWRQQARELLRDLEDEGPRPPLKRTEKDFRQKLYRTGP